MADAMAPSPATSMADAPTFGRESVANIDVASALPRAEAWVATLDEPAVGDKSDTVAFVREVRPYDIVEDMILDRINGRSRATIALASRPYSNAGVLIPIPLIWSR